MPFIDWKAAEQVKELREAEALSPEALSRVVGDKIEREEWRGGVDAHTIRRIERDGHVPSLRVQFVLASYFGKKHTDVWIDKNARRVAPTEKPSPVGREQVAA